MQYTSGSFGGIAARWFAWALQPRRTLRRPRGIFSPPGLQIERVPETVLDLIVRPIGAAVLLGANLARRLQHGRLQFYIAYVGAGLAALGTIVWLEEIR
jgi:hydrogenase-4 component B